MPVPLANKEYSVAGFMEFLREYGAYMLLDP